MGKYVQSFVALLSLIPMIEEYTQKVAFLHGLQPWVHKSIVQKSKVSKSCQEMMKITECMEDDFTFHKTCGNLASQQSNGNVGSSS